MLETCAPDRFGSGIIVSLPLADGVDFDSMGGCRWRFEHVRVGKYDVSHKVYTPAFRSGFAPYFGEP